MPGIIYKNVAFPLMFKMLDKRGNSGMRERISLIEQHIERFGKENTDSLLADREFTGDIRNNFKIYSCQKRKVIKAFWLFNSLKTGEFYHCPKIVELHGQSCYLSGTETVDREGKVGFPVPVSFNRPQQALLCYKSRCRIEILFNMQLFNQIM